MVIMKTYRITFSKSGSLIFVSHLDFSHSIIRALKRARLPLKYSEGFNPRPKLIFGLPLSVGTVGENEILDVTLNADDISNEEFKVRFGNALTSDMVIKSVEQPEIKLGKIKSAIYTIEFPKCGGLCDKIASFKDSLPAVTKKTKKGSEKQLDIMPLIYSFEVSETSQDVILTLELASSGENYLSPELVVQSLRQCGVDTTDEYQITRKQIIFAQ